MNHARNAQGRINGGSDVRSNFTLSLQGLPCCTNKAYISKQDLAK